MTSLTVDQQRHRESLPDEGAWRPVLHGELRAEALRTVDEIIKCLESAEDFRAGDRPDPSLAGGCAGTALLFAYHGMSRRQHANRQQARQRLCCAVDASASAPTVATLYRGLTGVGWACAHLPVECLPHDLGEVNHEIDESLLEYLHADRDGEEFDLIAGLTGYGVYALERVPDPAAVACLELIVDRLADAAVQMPQGIAWHTRPESLAPELARRYPDGIFDLSVAHGAAGVIAFLSMTLRAGIATDRGSRLLERAVDWLLAQKLPGDEALFPYWFVPGRRPVPSRLAWCRGDPGIAAALLLAARSQGRQDWEEEAITVALHAASRSMEQSGVRDAGLCHGSAGLGHLFNRFYQGTGDNRFAESARFWFRDTLMRRAGRTGLAGYQTWDPETDEDERWVSDPGFLTGVAGIGLSLLAACTETEPAWDRVLLASFPTGGVR